MNSVQTKMKNFKIHALIIFSLFILLFNYNSLIKNIHLSEHTNSIETRNETTGHILKNITTLHILNSFDSKKNGKRLNRIKRFILFDGAGVVKLVIGTSFPIIMADKVRSLNYFYNFQMQYVPPPIPLFWWSFYNTSTFPARNYKIEKRSTNKLAHYDKSRALLYKFIEGFLRNFGYSGSKCLSRIICEISRTPLEEDSDIMQLNNNANEFVEDYGRNIYHSLLNAIFIPVYSNVDERFIMARDAGTKGANCSITFGECYIVEEFFKQFTLLI